MRELNIGSKRFTKVVSNDDVGPGGAYHEYYICRSEPNSDTPAGEFGHVKIQNGPVKESGVNGCHNEDLIAIVIDRLQCFQSGEFSCRENASKDKWRKVGKKNRYVGVYFNKVTGTYQARIKIGDKRPSLGYFKCETAAHFAYQKKLSCLT